mgnify:CR=1 FL=1
MTTDIDTLNSHIYTLSASSDVINPTTLLLYRQYPTADGKSFEYIPELAESEPEQVDADGKIWQIKIRENAKWENGDSINVDDVIYSFQMCLDPLMVNNRASQLASDYITITKATDYYLQGTENKVSWDEVGIKRNGDYMLGLELDAPVTAADIKSHFNYVWTNLVHKPTYEAGMNEDRTKTSYGSTGDTYKSCGAYILTEWVPGSVFKMKKNPDYQLLTFNSGDLMPMVENTKNRSSNFRILAIMAVDKQLLFKGAGAKYDTFADVINAVENGEKVVIGGSKGDDIATYQALVAELGVSEDNLTYITYDSTGDAITAALGGHVEYVISKPAAASEYVEAGSLIPILAFSTERYTGNLADAPTLSELGYNDVEIPVWRGVAAPAAMSDEAAAYWSETLKTVSESDAWKTEYIEANKLIPNYMDTATATEYVTQYEADLWQRMEFSK